MTIKQILGKAKPLQVLCLCAGLSACGTVPITGRSSLNLVSDEELLMQSRQQYSSFVSQSRSRGMIVQDARITRITQNLINATKEYLINNNHTDLWEQMHWELNVVKSNDVNAFCMPGGKIVVYTGLAQMIGLGSGSDAELAAVIGHEIAHAIARHANERVSRAKLTSMGGNILSTILGSSESTQGSMIGTAVSVLYGLGTEVGVSLPFNRKQEIEADKMGMVLMAIAGYSPEFAVSLWQKMALSSGGGKQSSFLSTHPSEEKRIAEIQKYMPEAMKYYRPMQQKATDKNISNKKTNKTRQVIKL